MKAEGQTLEYGRREESLIIQLIRTHVRYVYYVFKRIRVNERLGLGKGLVKEKKSP